MGGELVRQSYEHLACLAAVLRPSKIAKKMKPDLEKVPCHGLISLKFLRSRPDEGTVKFQNFRTPEKSAVIYLKFKQRVQTLEYFVKKMQME